MPFREVGKDGEQAANGCAIASMVITRVIGLPPRAAQQQSITSLNSA